MSAAAEKVFERSGAVLRGHFLLTSGRHSPVYWEKFRVLQRPQDTVRLCKLIAEHFGPDGIQAVAGPTIGGAVLAYETARQLKVHALYAEKEEGGRTFRRGCPVTSGERVLVVDDVLTTGGSVREVIQAVGRAGGSAVGVAVLLDRSEQLMDFGVPFFACLRSPGVSYPADDCPLCKERYPITRLGGV